MRMKKFIPKSVVNYFRIINNNRRYPNTDILTPYIYKNVSLGNKVSLGREVYLGENVKVDNYSYIHNNTMIVSGEVGKYCSIAFNCQIGMWEHPTNYISTSPKTYANGNVFGFDPLWVHSKPPIIGNDVWIGSYAVIARNVKVGDGAVIGAGSIVTKDVPPYAIVVGSPAKIIKYRFDEETIKCFLDFKWWELEGEELKNFNNIFQSGEAGPSKLVDYISKRPIMSTF